MAGTRKRQFSCSRLSFRKLGKVFQNPWESTLGSARGISPWQRQRTPTRKDIASPEKINFLNYMAATRRGKREDYYLQALGSNNPAITAAGTKTSRVGLCCSRSRARNTQLVWGWRGNSHFLGMGWELSLFGDGSQPCSHQEMDPAVGGRSCHPGPLTAGWDQLCPFSSPPSSSAPTIFWWLKAESSSEAPNILNYFRGILGQPRFLLARRNFAPRSLRKDSMTWELTLQHPWGSPKSSAFSKSEFRAVNPSPKIKNHQN